MKRSLSVGAFRRWLKRCCYAAVGVALVPLLANAAISVNRTRLIVTEQERESSPQVLNEGAHPVLIQAWVDTGEAQMKVEQIRAAFIVDPPVFRLEPGQSRRLRVLMVQPARSLPADRESVFWFNVLEIPPKATNIEDANHLQLSFRTRLKIFFRPGPVADHVLSDSDALKFILQQDGGQNVSLKIRNPAPLHQTLNTLTVIDPMGRQTTLDPIMIAPRQAVEIPFNLDLDGASGGERWHVHFSTIDDFGVAHEQEWPLAFE